MALARQTYTNDGGRTVNGISITNPKTGDQYIDKLRQATVNASQRSANDRGGMNGMFNPGTTYTKNSVGEVVNKPGTTGQGAQRVEAWRTANTPKTASAREPSAGINPPVSSEVYAGGSSHSATDDIVSMIKSLLEEQKAQADQYYKTLYDQQIAQNKQAYESDRNQINTNYMRGQRYLNSIYGDNASGQGLSNRARNSQSWQSNLASARQNYTNNDATALSQYNMNKANTASQLAQGWYNYVLPVYTNRQQNEDDYAYRRYIASL